MFYLNLELNYYNKLFNHTRDNCIWHWTEIIEISAWNFDVNIINK